MHVVEGIEKLIIGHDSRVSKSSTRPVEEFIERFDRDGSYQGHRWRKGNGKRRPRRLDNFLAVIAAHQEAPAEFVTATATVEPRDRVFEARLDVG